MTTFGQYVSEKRKSLRRTQADIAKHLSLSVAELNDIENDRLDPRQDNLIAGFADVLSLDPSALTNLAEAFPENFRFRRELEDDEYKSLAAFRLSRG